MAFGPRSRVVGVDDGPFRGKTGARVPIVGVLMRGPRVEGVMTTHVIRHGSGATRSIGQMLTTGRIANQAQAVLLDGIAFPFEPTADLNFSDRFADIRYFQFDTHCGASKA